MQTLLKLMTSIVFFLIFSPNALWSLEVKSVGEVDLSKYAGLWFEIERIPNRFQDNTSQTKSACFNVTAEYKASSPETLSVTNTCQRIYEGVTRPEVARAVASVVAGTGNSQLKVNFTGLGVLRWLGIGTGDYWILALGPVQSEEQYAWALVGDPLRKYGWILSRTKNLEEAELKKIFKIAEVNGYARSQFVSSNGTQYRE